MTYTWEQYDNARSAITSSNLGNTNHGGSFRSKMPSTSPTRYFPDLNTVLSGSVRDLAGWESASTVARPQSFRLTVRDNHPDVTQQQTNSILQSVNVGSQGPFKINTTYLNTDSPSVLEWDVANTNNAPYNVSNVKIDYTTDNGATWTVLFSSTPNDGNEVIDFGSSFAGQTIKLRISAIGNIFYAVKSITLAPFSTCDGSALSGIVITNVTHNSAAVNWPPSTVSGTTYEIRYRKVNTANWITRTSTSTSITLNNLMDQTQYELQVAAKCAGTTSAFSNSILFNTSSLPYCQAYSQGADYEYISNVTLANLNNDSGPSTYTSYYDDPALQINLVRGQQYTISVAKNWVNNVTDYDAVSAWIDFNRNGRFDSSERILTSPVTLGTTIPTIVSARFTVPNTAVTDSPLRMRVINLFAGQDNSGLNLTDPCFTFDYGEVEDYQVVVLSQMSTSEVVSKDALRIYPNPTTHTLNFSKISNKAQYEIVNPVGQIVLKGMITDNKVDVSALEKGNYIITVKDKSATFSEKFIKK